MTTIDVMKGALFTSVLLRPWDPDWNINFRAPAAVTVPSASHLTWSPVMPEARKQLLMVTRSCALFSWRSLSPNPCTERLPVGTRRRLCPVLRPCQTLLYLIWWLGQRKVLEGVRMLPNNTISLTGSPSLWAVSGKAQEWLWTILNDKSQHCTHAFCSSFGYRNHSKVGQK